MWLALRRAGARRPAGARVHLGAPRRRRGLDERAAVVRARGTPAIADAVLGRWFTPAFRDAQPRTVARIRAMLGATAAEGYAALLRGDRALDFAPT